MSHPAQSATLTTPQAARRYRIPLRTLQLAIKRGELPAQRLDVRGGTYVLDPEDVAAFKRDRAQKVAALKRKRAQKERRRQRRQEGDSLAR